MKTGQDPAEEPGPKETSITLVSRKVLIKRNEKVYRFIVYRFIGWDIFFIRFEALLSPTFFGVVEKSLVAVNGVVVLCSTQRIKVSITTDL